MPLQRYVSRELTHFVGKGKSEEDQYSLLILILRGGWLTHAPHDPAAPSKVTKTGNKHFSTGGMYSADAVCFCDIPLGDFDIHMQKYSRFALAFPKSYLLSRGANPVFYIANDSVIDVSASALAILGTVKESIDSGGRENITTRAALFNTLMHENTAIHERLASVFFQLGQEHFENGRELTETLGRLRIVQMEFTKQVFALCKPFEGSRTEVDAENYYMEREWRVLGNVKFDLADVCRIIIPRSFSRRFRKDLPDYLGQVTFAD